MSQRIQTHTFDNGLQLVGERMDWLESAAFSILLPAGCIHDSADLPGVANFTCDMVERGCGDMNSRQFLEALENQGITSHSSVDTAHTAYGAALVADALDGRDALLVAVVSVAAFGAVYLGGTRLAGVDDGRLALCQDHAGRLSHLHLAQQMKKGG